MISRVIKYLKKIAKITGKNGLKFTFRMIFIRCELEITKLYSPIIIAITKKVSFGKKDSRRVLIIMEDEYSVSAVNRGLNLREYLKEAGYKPTLVATFSCAFQLLNLQRYSAVVMQRTICIPVIIEIVKRSKKLNIPVIYDCDDLLFAPGLAENIHDDIKTDVQWWKKNSLKYNSVYSLCDYFLTSTEFLADVAKKDGKKSFVLRNGLNKKSQVFASILYDVNHDEISVASEEFSKANNLDKVRRVVIGYQSGTSTHNKDFELVAPAIYKIMHEDSRVCFEIFGYLDLPEIFNDPKLRSRIIRQGVVPFDRLLHKLASFHINIAPSIVGNPFTEGKSELKYVYAGALAIPTVASPTSAFKYAIKNGENGFLAHNEDEWYTYLKKIVDYSEVRKTIGENAFADVMDKYSVKPLSQRAKEIFDEILK